MRFAALMLALATVAGCVGQAGNSPNESIPPQTSFQILGDFGTPFSAVISDSFQSWRITGVIPLTVAIINNNPPVRMIANKLTNSSALMSIEIISAGVTVVQAAATTDPFGTVSVQLGGTLSQLAIRAFPDVRFFVKGPPTEIFTGLIEDQNNSHQIGASAPALFLFEFPSGTVDGQFTQSENFGSFDIDLTINGGVVATGMGGPMVIVKAP